MLLVDFWSNRAILEQTFQISFHYKVKYLKNVSLSKTLDREWWEIAAQFNTPKIDLN